MLRLISFLLLCFFAINSNAAEVRTKKVCQNYKMKSGKVVRKCTTIKIHKKLQGTKVPTDKKNKKWQKEKIRPPN